MRMKDKNWKSDLEPLFNPASIAVVGISGGPRLGMGANAVRNLLDFGYKGKILPVNPKYDEIFGFKCFKQISEIPGDLDSLFIAIPSEGVIPVLRQAVEKNVKSAIIFSSGFAESDERGKGLQEEIITICEENQIRLCGPNNMGVISFHERFWLFTGNIPKDVYPGGLAFVGQSGSLTLCALVAANVRGIGFNYIVTSGNEAVLEASDYFRFFVDDPHTRVIGCFIESFKNPENLRQVAEIALAKNIPIIILKIGRSKKGQWAALSHTGSLTGSDVVQDSFFKQKGLIRVTGIEELVETAGLFTKTTLPKRNRLAFSMTSGGGCGLVSDICDQYDLNITDLSEETKLALKPLVPAFGSIDNPLDLTGYAYRNPEMYYKCIEILLKENVDIVCIDIEIPWIEHLFDKVQAYARKTNKLICFFSFTSEDMTDMKRKMWRESAVPILQDLVRGLKSIRSLVRYCEINEERKLIQPVEIPSHQNRDRVSNFLANCSSNLIEFESKKLLQLYGIPITKEGLVGSVDEAIDIARNIGYPVALKIQCREILHKTEVGGILLNIRDEIDLKSGYEKILERVRNYHSNIRVEGVLVQEMVENGIEFILGMSQDSHFGPCIMFGSGGIYVEALMDISLRVAPVTEMDAISMIKEIRSYKILQGFRGRPSIDIKTLAKIIIKLSQFALDFKDKLKEIDINPILLVPETDVIKAADARVVMK